MDGPILAPYIHDPQTKLHSTGLLIKFKYMHYAVLKKSFKVAKNFYIWT